MSKGQKPLIGVCGYKDKAPDGVMRLAVSSRAMIFNPPEWKDLWLLSPLSTVDPGIDVPGMQGVQSRTVENAWQFLKIWPGEDRWCEPDAREAFRSTCAIRYPRGRGAKAIGAYWGEDGSTLGYVEARKRIYVPCYLELLSRPDRAACVDRLRELATRQPVRVWDPDSYDIEQYGMTDTLEALEFEGRPFAHAFLVALAVQERLGGLQSPANQNEAHSGL